MSRGTADTAELYGITSAMGYGAGLYALSAGAVVLGGLGLALAVLMHGIAVAQR